MTKIRLPGPREAKIEQWVCDQAFKLYLVEAIKLNLGGNNGWPDRLFWIPGGRPFLIEFKRPGEPAEPLQGYIHAKLKKLGYDVEVYDDRDTALEAIRRRVEASPLPGQGRDAARGKRVPVPFRKPRRR